jgi:hypothetical protein
MPELRQNSELLSKCFFSLKKNLKKSNQWEKSEKLKRNFLKTSKATLRVVRATGCLINRLIPLWLLATKGCESPGTPDQQRVDGSGAYIDLQISPLLKVNKRITVEDDLPEEFIKVDKLPRRNV